HPLQAEARDGRCDPDQDDPQDGLPARARVKAPGRLFWKIFFASLCALLVVAAASGAAVWLNRSEHARPDAIAGGPSTEHATRYAAATLKRAGPQALRDALESLASDPVPQPFVVD